MKEKGMIYYVTKIYDGNLDCFADFTLRVEIMNFTIQPYVVFPEFSFKGTWNAECVFLQF